MSCREFRLVIGAEPGGSTPELEAHLQSCTSCREFRREMRTLDQDIQRALALDIGSMPRSAPARPRVTKLGRPRWALAASIVAAMVGGFALWSADPRSSLARDVVDHMKYEPHAWVATMPVERSALTRVFGRIGMTIDPVEGGDIVFVETCLVRGKLVPHFVVRTDQGPYTVLILSDEEVKGEERFATQGYTGILVPSDRGTIAILNRNAADPHEEAERVMRALHIVDAASVSG
jgi:hypothetical protein